MLGVLVGAVGLGLGVWCGGGGVCAPAVYQWCSTTSQHSQSVLSHVLVILSQYSIGHYSMVYGGSHAAVCAGRGEGQGGGDGEFSVATAVRSSSSSLV